MSGSIEGLGPDTGRGHCVTTFSGQPFWPMDPRPEDIRLDDIAHALALQCRFNGAVMAFYSVAEHSVRMAKALNFDRDLAREALLHDAAEAYIGDLVRPVKAHCPDWCAIDARVDAAVRERFGLPPTMSDKVREADLRMLATERRDLLAAQATEWRDLPEPYDFRIRAMGWVDSKALFLQFADWLGVG